MFPQTCGGLVCILQVVFSVMLAAFDSVLISWERVSHKKPLVNTIHGSSAHSQVALGIPHVD